MPLLSNPKFDRYIDDRRLLEEIFKVRDLTDTDILLSEDEFNEQEQLRQQVEQLQQQVQQGMQLLQALEKMAPNLVRQAVERMGSSNNARSPQRGG